MTNLVESFNEMVYYNDSLDEGEELTKFFGVLESFNYQMSININIKRNIEQYFDYRWMKDKNAAISLAEDKFILE